MKNSENLDANELVEVPITDIFQEIHFFSKKLSFAVSDYCFSVSLLSNSIK